jgi:hypothetical protein
MAQIVESSWGGEVVTVRAGGPSKAQSTTAAANREMRTFVPSDFTSGFLSPWLERF